MEDSKPVKPDYWRQMPSLSFLLSPNPDYNYTHPQCQLTSLSFLLELSPNPDYNYMHPQSQLTSLLTLPVQIKPPRTRVNKVPNACI